VADGTGSPGSDAVIRVVWGTGTGPTALAAYDAALAAAGVENYNLTTVSSIVPADVSVDAVGTAPDLGPPGNRLTVVEARATTEAGDPSGEPATAGLAWTVAPGPGIFYEVGGSFDEHECRRRLDEGLTAGRELRDWDVRATETRVQTVEPPAAGFATAVVLGVYGASEPIVG